MLQKACQAKRPELGILEDGTQEALRGAERQGYLGDAPETSHQK